MADSSNIDPEKKFYNSNDFNEYLIGIIHDWSKTLTTLAYTLVPLFFILDYFTMPRELLPRFAFYRVIATIIALIQYIVVKNTKPSKISYVHGYLVSLILGGVIALMTVDLGGFSSGYYAGLNLVIIGVNILLPWETYHSAINGLMTILMYVVLNVVFGGNFNANDLTSNLFFMNATVIISVSINLVRSKLIKREFALRSEVQNARDALWGEMEVAKKIQTSLLPKNKRIGSYEMAALMEPAAEIGGDYYDAVETNAGENWVMIGDVSGHGVESGLIMMMTQTSIFSIINDTPGQRPMNVINNVNSVIRKNISRLGSNMYMTLFAIRLENDSVMLAGKHQDIIIYRAKSGTVDVIQVQGTWIGLADDIAPFLSDIKIEIFENDIMLLFTDGVTEAMNDSGEMFNQDRLIALFKIYSSLSPENIVRNIAEDIGKFQKKQYDDITLIALKKNY